jgi:hypothetical protein
MGSDPFDAASELEAHVRIVQDGPVVRGVLALYQAGAALGEPRELEAPEAQCGALASAMAASLSIAIDALEHTPAAPIASPPESAEAPTSEPAVSSTEPTPEADAGVTRDAPAPPTPPSEASDQQGPRFYGDVGFELTLARTPDVAIGPALTLGLVWSGMFRLAARGRVGLMPERSMVTPLDAVSATFVTGGILGCVNWEPLEFCASVDAGSLQAASTGAADPRVSSAFVAYAGVQVGAVLPLSDAFALVGVAGLEAVLSRMNLRVADATIWTASPVAAVFRVDLRILPFP